MCCMLVSVVYNSVTPQAVAPWIIWTSLVAQLLKNLPAVRETWVRSLVGKIPWRRERLPTPVFWSGEFHGLYSPWGHKESDTTERLSLHRSPQGAQGWYQPWSPGKMDTIKTKVLQPDLLGSNATPSVTGYGAWPPVSLS